MAKLIDLTGQEFGELTVIKRASNAKDGRACWLCKCGCGKEIIIQGEKRGEHDNSTEIAVGPRYH